jgi:hypothetical protein
MDKEYVYTDGDYHGLEAALFRAECVCSPDRYQFLQNELSKEIASFLLRPYKMKKLKEKNEK